MTNTVQDTQAQPVPVSFGSIAMTILALLFTGAVGGAVASFAILGAKAVVDQLTNPASTGFTQLLGSILSRMFNVLTMWAQAPRDGAIMGATAGVAVSLAYLAVLWLSRRAALATWISLLLLVIAGAIGAALASQGVLADLRVWTAAAGALFGLGAAYAIFSPRSSSP